MTSTRLASIGFIVALWAIAAAMATHASAQASAAPTAAADPRLYFDRMARFLADAPQFQTRVRMGYDVVQESGQKIEFGERHWITIARPDRLWAQIQKSDGEKGVVIFDGKKVTAYSSTQKAYAQAEKRGDLDAALEYFLRDLRMRLPLALMFRSDFAKEMERRLLDLEFVEVSAVTDIPCVHLAGRTDEVDFQVWIPQSGKPLPRRLIISYRGEEGHPGFWADFEDWNMTPTIDAADFRFTPPAGSERIPFLVEIARALPQADSRGDQ